VLIHDRDGVLAVFRWVVWLGWRGVKSSADPRVWWVEWMATARTEAAFVVCNPHDTLHVLDRG
jgi:hypothetical protein